MKLRITAPPEEADRAASRVCRTFDVLSVSGHYPQRGSDGRLVRVYLEVAL